MTTILPAVADDYSVYLAFPPATDLAVAIARYKARIGASPLQWFEYNSQIWLGPAPEWFVLRPAPDDGSEDEPGQVGPR